MRFLLSLIICSAVLQPLHAQFGGELDTTFHHDGLAVSNIGIGYDVGFDLAIQPDGNILVGGGSNFIAGTETDFSFVRFLSNGNPDISFGGDGIVTTDFSMLYDLANAMYLMPDGRFLAGGYTGGDWAVARYLPNGDLDTTFSGDGKFTLDFDTENDQVTGLGMQSDGKIIVGGFATIDGFFARFCVARLLDNGTLDTTFGTDGYTSVVTFGYWDQAYACLVRPDDKIILAGYTSDAVYDYDFTVMQFDPEGILDPAFGTGGIVRTDFDGEDDYAVAALLQTDGKIILAGGSGTTPYQHVALVRYNGDGSIDASFGVDGKVVMDIDTTVEEFATSLTWESDQKIVVGGAVGLYAVGYDYLVIKLLPNGMPDNTFSDDGIVTTHLSDDWDIVYATGVQDDGKIIAAGFLNDTGDNEYAVVRYLNSGGPECDSITAQPEDIDTVPGGPVFYSVETGFGTGTFQWQVNEGGGWADIPEGGFYSGTTTDTLWIEPVFLAMNGYNFRCIVSGPGCRDTSDAVLLNVSGVEILDQWAESITVFPNPVINGIFEITFPANINMVDMIITDLNGRCIKNIENPVSGIQIKPEIPAGIYFLWFTRDTGDEIFRKLVITH